MIDERNQNRRHVAEVVETLRESFETKHADICRDHDALREVISFYDILLKDLIDRELRSREEADDFLKAHIPFLLGCAPIVQKKAIGIMAEMRRAFPNGSVRKLKLPGKTIEKMCPDHPLAKFSGGQEITLDLDNHLLLSRNFLAVYIGDPIKTEAHYRNLKNIVS